MRATPRLLTLITALSLFPTAALAGHHRWDFSEVFSNGDGTVQFVELSSANDNEQALNGFTITSNAETFTFVGNLPSNLTANTWVLVGTAAFALEAGAPTPDYVLPDNFFDPASDSLTYAGGADTWAISGVPTNGVDSLDRTTGEGTNTPTNFAGDTGSVDLSPPVNQTPAIGTWGIVLLVGAILLGASGVIRRSVRNPVQG